MHACYMCKGMYICIYVCDVYVIKTHGSESRGQGGSTSRQTHVSILQEQNLLK